MKITFLPCTAFALEPLANLINQAFDGYVGGTVKLTSESLAGFISTHGVNLALSQVIQKGDDLAGIALVARRGSSSRLVMMGIAPEFKRQGLGRHLLEQLIANARARHDKLYELEVIEQNPAAVKLYKQAGFKPLQRLLELSANSPQGSAAPVKPIAMKLATQQLISYGAPDLPWQISGYNLIQLGPPHLAFQLGPAYAILSDPNKDTIILHMVIVEQAARGQKHGTKLIQALFAMYPERTWRILALCPEETVAFFEQAGFARGKLSQWQMRLGL